MAVRPMCPAASPTFAAFPDLVENVAPGDSGHAVIVADHIAFVARLLHAHHAAEDALIWPKLERAAHGRNANRRAIISAATALEIDGLDGAHELAERLLAQTGEQCVNLVGPKRAVEPLTRNMLETASTRNRPVLPMTTSA